LGHPRDGRLINEFVTQTIELPSGELKVLQPADAAEIPDDHQVEWAPIAPYSLVPVPVPPVPVP
jgi:hypothetical protein